MRRPRARETEKLETSFKDGTVRWGKTGPMTNAAPPAAPPRLIEIMRTGRQTDAHGRVVDFTAGDLKAIADAYDPKLAPAPVVVGHPKMDAPAYGWLKRLVAEGDSLFAEEEDVAPEFDEMRRARRFRNRSASFYLAGSPGNPKPGGMYIKHVGWLGAAAPAVKGLKQVAFAEEEDGVVEFALGDRRWGFRAVSDALRRLREYLIDANGQDTADRAIPDYLISSIAEAAQPDPETDAIPAFAEPVTGDPDMTQQNDLAERERQLKEREARVAAQETAQAKAVAQARRSEAVAFAENLIKDGRLLPARKDTVVELMLALPTEAPLAFGEGDERVEKPAAELFRELLGAYPAQIDFAEKSEGGAAIDGIVSFAAPPGVTVDAGRSKLYVKAKAYQQQHPHASWTDAVAAVGG